MVQVLVRPFSLSLDAQSRYAVHYPQSVSKNCMTCLVLFSRELKHRAIQHPNEPKFQIHEYIEAQKEKSGCCSYF